MLIFYDWEFEENGVTIEPISFGAVSETGDEIYLINQDYDWNNCKNPYVLKNVKPNLIKPLGKHVKWLIENVRSKSSLPLADLFHTPKNELGNNIEYWLRYIGVKKAKLVANYSAYDHVCLGQRFGVMLDMPDILPWVSYDLKQWIDDLGINEKDLPQQQTGEHNALLDARHNFTIYQYLVKNYYHPAWDKRTHYYNLLI